MTSLPTTKRNNVVIAIIKTGLLAGTLDALAAILWEHLYFNMDTASIFKYIAGGIFGKAAFADGFNMVLYGVLIHYFIASIFTIILFLLYPFISFRLKNKYIVGILYGLVIWLIMNLIVLPLSNTAKYPFNINHALIACGILIVCVGLPISLMANRHYYKEKGGLLYL
jgi:hypothetical protein